MGGLRAGTLDREIVLETAAAVQSPSGEESLDWDHATAIPLFAEWLPGGTTEAYRAQQRLGAYIDGVFKVYDLEPRPAPDASRIVWNGIVYDLKPYVEIGRGEGLLLPVVARAV